MKIMMLWLLNNRNTFSDVEKCKLWCFYFSMMDTYSDLRKKTLKEKADTICGIERLLNCKYDILCCTFQQIIIIVTEAVCGVETTILKLVLKNSRPNL